MIHFHGCGVVGAGGGGGGGQLCQKCLPLIWSVYSEMKEFAPGANSFFVEYTPFCKGLMCTKNNKKKKSQKFCPLVTKAKSVPGESSLPTVFFEQF